eukprot:5493217-Prymnesium_polylepis.1
MAVWEARAVSSRIAAATSCAGRGSAASLTACSRCAMAPSSRRGRAGGATDSEQATELTRSRGGKRAKCASWVGVTQRLFGSTGCGVWGVRP